MKQKRKRSALLVNDKEIKNDVWPDYLRHLTFTPDSSYATSLERYTLTLLRVLRLTGFQSHPVCLNYVCTICTTKKEYDVLLLCDKEEKPSLNNLERLIHMSSLRKIHKKSNTKWYRLLHNQRVRKVYISKRWNTM